MTAGLESHGSGDITLQYDDHIPWNGDTDVVHGAHALPSRR